MPWDNDEDDFDDHDAGDIDDYGDDDDLAEPTVPCPYCRREIHEDAVRCPYCEQFISQEDAPPARKPWWIIAGAIICLYIAWRWIIG
ncbi:MAG: hypothetical protein K2Y37_15230 [Pirellulales bacterium]|nr:hypothetical protein [Pirellulales bacterium]